MMKRLPFCLAALASANAVAAEPDGLILPPGFHAEVVASGLKGVRHLAIRDNGDLYVSTRGEDEGGIIALRLNAQHQPVEIRRFGDVRNGTGIRFDHGYLYASAPGAVYRFHFDDASLVPAAVPELVVSGMPESGFRNRMLAFDGKGGLFVSIGGEGNICAETKEGTKEPVGRSPCPDLATRSGIWRFDAHRLGQHFPEDGERVATGVRDTDALDWRAGDGLYAVMHGRNGTAETWPQLVSQTDDDAIAEEMHRIGKGADLGWPYTYYDGVRNVRLTAPEYRPEGHSPAERPYSVPVAVFPGHAAPLDMLFYEGHAFPRQYRGGAFVALHGGLGPARPTGHPGFAIDFVPFDRRGHAQHWQSFAEGFAGAGAAMRNVSTAAYRPTGLAVGPDGALYVIDSVKGRLWRISYKG